MKLRGDFVTNSSSSSFIFTKDDMPAIRNKFKSKEKEIEYEEGKDGLICFASWMNSIELTPIREHEVYEIMEVAEWYRDDVYEKFLDGYREFHDAERYSSWEENRKLRKQYMDSIKDKQLSDVTLNKMTLFLMIDFIKDIMQEKRGTGLKIVPDYITEEEIELWMISSFSIKKYCINDDILYEVLLYNYDKIYDIAKQYANVPAGVLLEELLEAKYMYYDSIETHYWIADVMKESEYCIYGCCHMG